MTMADLSENSSNPVADAVATPAESVATPATKPLPYQTSSRHWLKRHRLIIITLVLSFAAHSLLLIKNSSEKEIISSRVINAQLVTTQPQGANEQDQDPSLEQSQSLQPQPEQQQGNTRNSGSAEPQNQDLEAAVAIETTEQDQAASADKKIVSSQASSNHQVAPAQTSESDLKSVTVTEAKQPPQEQQKKVQQEAQREVAKEKTQPTEITDTVKPEQQPGNSAQSSEQQNHQLKQQQRELQKQGIAEQFSDPIERSYVQQLLTHLDQKIIAPQAFSGKVRLSLTINFGQIVTQVEVLESSGNQQIDSWVTKAAIGANPYPQVPPQLNQPYIFRPTIDLGGQ